MSSSRIITGILALAALSLAAGCAKPKASLQYVAGGPEEIVNYDMAVYQLARGDKVQLILYHRTAAPVGYADPDFEYVFFELPQRPTFGWLKEDNVPIYRWVRHREHDFLWQGTAGQVEQRITQFRDDQRCHLTFKVTMEPVAGTAGGEYVFTGSVRYREDIVATQGLVNRYNDWMLSVLGLKPKITERPSTPKVPGLPGAAKSSSKKKKSPLPSTGTAPLLNGPRPATSDEPPAAPAAPAAPGTSPSTPSPEPSGPAATPPPSSQWPMAKPAEPAPEKP